jgi:hypothetical protein
MQSRSRRPDQIEAEVQEIYEVLRREAPHRSTFELWTKALSLHRVRYARDVLALDEEGKVVNH